MIRPFPQWSTRTNFAFLSGHSATCSVGLSSRSSIYLYFQTSITVRTCSANTASHRILIWSQLRSFRFLLLGVDGATWYDSDIGPKVCALYTPVKNSQNILRESCVQCTSPLSGCIGGYSDISVPFEALDQGNAPRTGITHATRAYFRLSSFLTEVEVYGETGSGSDLWYGLTNCSISVIGLGSAA